MRKTLIASALTFAALTMTACGGGSEGGDNSSQAVPETATKTLSNNSDEARALAKNTVEGSSTNASTNQSQSRLSKVSSLPGIGPGSSASIGESLKHARLVTLLTTKSALKETRVITCDHLTDDNNSLPQNERITNCSGSIDLDSNFSENTVGTDGLIAAGTFFNMTFNNLSYQTVDQGSVFLSGILRFEYVEAFRLNPVSGEMRFQAINLSGTSDGESFGPENLDYRIRLDGSNVTLIGNDVRLRDFQVSFVDSDSFTISGGTAIDGYDGAFIEVTYDNWQVIDGVPQTGSRLTATGENGSATIVVDSVSGNTINLTVTIVTDGQSNDYSIQANSSNGQVTVL